jgi:class 3 adenylate cyclase/tetratricopeptide (TPR) repeat protein
MTTTSIPRFDLAAAIRTKGWRAAIADARTRISLEEDPNTRSFLRVELGRALIDHGDLEGGANLLGSIEQGNPHVRAARIGLAVLALREKRFDAALAQLEAANRLGDPSRAGAPPERSAQAEIQHLRGTVYLHLGRPEESRQALVAALQLYERSSVGFARATDTAGMLFAELRQFHAARNAFHAALRMKKKLGDDDGLALTYGNLGRLCLAWGRLDEAEASFRADLQIAARTDPRGHAQVRNALALVEIARSRWEAAAALLDETIASAITGQWATIEAFARKDRAYVACQLRDLTGAEQHLDAAAPILSFPEGRAHLQLVWGELFRASLRFPAAEEMFQAAATQFESMGELDWGARARLEEAKTMAFRGASRNLVLEKLLGALDVAEKARRPPIVQDIEAALRAHAPDEYFRRILTRFQGHAVRYGPAVLGQCVQENLSLMFLDLADSSAWLSAGDPQEVMLMLDDLFADIEAVCERHDGMVANYVGDGMLVLFREETHEQRAVEAAADVVSHLAKQNQLRRCVDQDEAKVRIGVTSGNAIVGFMGTYGKMVHNVVGALVDEATSIHAEAAPMVPCLSASTFAKVRNIRCVGPRSRSLKGLPDAHDLYDLALP